MDFAFNEEQDAVRDLATQIFEGMVNHDSLKELFASGQHVDTKVWGELAKAGLIGIALPEEHGGNGLGFLEVALVLEQIGKHVVPVPYLPTTVAAMAIAEFGSDTLKKSLLPQVVAGDLVLASALVESGADLDDPQTSATREGDGWRLDGVKDLVQAGLDAGRVLVPARVDGEGVAIFVVDPKASGVTVQEVLPTNRIPEARIELAGVTVSGDDLLVGPDRGAEALDWIVARATVGLCAIATGVCEKALRMTAEYATNRKQFERPIATFQAVGQRTADAFIDTEAIRLTTWQEAWRLHEGMPSTAEVATAKFWAAEGGQRVLHAAAHIHGGIGVDTDYPLHRYFLWAKWLELSLGGASQHLRKLGALLAAEPA